VGNDGGDAAPQHTPGIPYTGTVHRHIGNLVGHAGLVGFIQVLQLEAMLAISAAVAIDFDLPRDKLIVITGLSGSGKS
jgi:Excinuclease ATPase subunit